MAPLLNRVKRGGGGGGGNHFSQTCQPKWLDHRKVKLVTFFIGLKSLLYRKAVRISQFFFEYRQLSSLLLIFLFGKLTLYCTCTAQYTNIASEPISCKT